MSSKGSVASRRWIGPLFAMMVIGSWLIYSKMVTQEKEQLGNSQTKKILKSMSTLLPLPSPSQPAAPFSTTTEAIFQAHFPQCLPLHLLLKEDNRESGGSEWSTTLVERWLEWLDDGTHKAPVNKSRALFKYVPSTSPPRYNHTSCSVMKARYNCAKPVLAATQEGGGSSMTENKRRKQAASEYKFVWRQDPESAWCDLQSLMDFVGGPAGLTQRNVMIQGNSFLRQIWEAMVCGFKAQVTNLTLTDNGPPISKASTEARHGKLIAKQELGNFLINEQNATAGCHGVNSGIETFYHKNVTVPPNKDRCSDDIAMVEFANKLRLFYVFHPSRYDSDALMNAYSLLNLPKKVDVTVWNDKHENILHNFKTGSLWSFDNLLASLKRVQKHSIGFVFGANNPWITAPPDNHPCLPGIPDDEVNILLYLLLLEDYERTLPSQ
jgi:hypothetical protein